MTPTCLALAVLVSASPKRVYIDAGHGAPGNDGNRGAYCQLEKDHTLAVAQALEALLPTLGPYIVKVSRHAEEQPTYQQRIRDAEAWRADVVVSLHSDSRGLAWPWLPFAYPAPDPSEPAPWGPLLSGQRSSNATEGTGTVCFRNALAPGYAVLWNDVGPAPTVAARARLGRAVSVALRAVGFGAYHGADYEGLYKPDPVVGGFIDLRPNGQNVYFLRASAIPTVIIETHHALDVADVEQWRDPATATHLAEALAHALQAYFAP